MAVTAFKPRTATPRAPMPADPVRQFSFTDFQVANPTTPPPGDRLDAEFDRADNAISDTITWASTSLNTDGSIRDAIIGENNLVPGLFDSISSDTIADVQPLVDQANAAAGQATSSASAAASSASAAAVQNTSAQAAATGAASSSSAAATSASAALTSQNTAQTQATNASNSANHADSEAALCTDYGIVTQAWAEHMPDIIPPNILAVMGVTGDHWSSRWWANKAVTDVENATAEAICDLQAYWLGAYPTPPTHNSCGEAVVAGAMYYDTTDQVCKVYDGAIWHDVTQLAPGKTDEFLYLPAVPTTVFSGLDYHGVTLALDIVNSKVEVYLNGVKLLENIDYSLTSTSVTMLLGSVTTPNSVEIMALHDATARPPPSGVKVNTSIWVFNGVTLSFPLQTSTGTAITPPGAVDCIVSLNGVIQEAGGDFTISGSQISFMVPPEADADKWMVVGLPLGGGMTLAATAEAETGPRGRRGLTGPAGPAGPPGPRSGDLAARVEELALQVEALEEELETVNARLIALEARL